MPGPHPRLLFDPADVPRLRKRATREPYASMRRACLRMADDPAYLATLYVLTGDEAYARRAEDDARAEVEADLWNDLDAKGLSRAAAARKVADAYDRCFDVWTPDTRRLVSRKLLQAARGMVKTMGRQWNTRVANNWQGVRFAASCLAALACDEPGGPDLAQHAYAELTRHLHANLGDNGWNPEGVGYTQYPWLYTGPAGIAAYRAGLGDLRRDVPRVARTFWHTFAGTVPIPTTEGRLGLRADLSDDHPSWSSNGMAGMAFWYAPQAEWPAYRWMYDALHGPDGAADWDRREGGAIYSLLYYPADVQPRNPAEVFGLDFADASAGVAVFRNRFRDENDVVCTLCACSRRPRGCHRGPDTNTFRLTGLGSMFVTGGGRTVHTAGQTNLFPGPPPARGTGGLGALARLAFTPDGGGSALVTGSCMGTEDHRRLFAVDYSGRCGAPALLVSAETSANGRLWRLNTPEFNAVVFDGNRFTIAGPTASTLVGTVLQPARPAFRTGAVERGGGMEHAGFPYRGKKYAENIFLEFDCDRRVLVVMTIQKDAAPPLTGSGTATAADLVVGGRTVKVTTDAVNFA